MEAIEVKYDNGGGSGVAYKAYVCTVVMITISLFISLKGYAQ
jgi:hypothetical protein